MIGFFSICSDPSAIVKKEDLYFVSVPDGLNENDIKERFAPLSKLYADKLNVNEVFLHFGKDYITYEFKV